MRSGRPETDTEHVLEAVYEDGEGRVAAEGRLLAPDGTEWFGFVDTFVVGDGGIGRLRTYTDARGDWLPPTDTWTDDSRSGARLIHANSIFAVWSRGRHWPRTPSSW